MAWFLALLSVARADQFSACVEGVAQRDLAAKIAYQEGMRDLIVAGRPEFEGLANISRDLQVAMSKARAVKYGYLLRHDPDRITTGQGLSKFRNFDWTDADEAAFARDSAQYAALRDQAARLHAKNDGHPDWPALRDYVRSELMQDAAFTALMREFSANDAELGPRLRGCRDE